MTLAYHRAYAEIDLGAIDKNFDALKKLCKSDVKAMAIVKADGYGHGAVEVARLLHEKADYFGVASVEEGIELRENGITKPVLVLAYTSPLQYNLLLEYGLMPTIFSLSDAVLLNEAAKKENKKAQIHIAVDTGMNRIGFAPNDESIDAIEKIYALPFIDTVGLFSHYAKADFEDKTGANKQTALFDEIIEKLESRNINIPVKHICNSAGIIDLQKHYDMVRMGIALYGMYPSDEVKKEKTELYPAMQVFSNVTHVKTVKKGEEIGYGGLYKAESDRIIATVSIGYADGFNRALTGKGFVLIRGKKAPVVGKVCMDQIMVDVTDIEGVKVGSVAVIIGRSGDEYISAELFGELGCSFAYEAICTFTKRVTKLFRMGE